MGTRCKLVPNRRVKMETPGTSDVRAYPACKICDRGTLMPRKIRRLSGPAVAIGYILLIPSILGMAGCAILLVVSLFAGVAGAAHGSAFATAFAGISTIAFVYIGIFCFVSGLLGWLLIMKKHVLQCGYCGAVVNAVAPISSQSERSAASARNVILGALFILGITGAIWAFVVAEAGIQNSTSTATATGPAQPTPDNSTAEPAQHDARQPFTSADGRFSILFPSAPQQSSGPIDLGNGETVTFYKFSATADNIKYVVVYADCPQEVRASASSDAFLQMMEKSAIVDKTLSGDYGFDFNGVPARAFTAADSTGAVYIAQEFLAGTRFYSLLTVSTITPTHYPNTQFMNSFKILGNPPTTVDNSTAPRETPEPAPVLSFQPSPESTDLTPTPASRSGWKTYEAANGEKFRVNMATIRHTQLGVMVWGAIQGIDIVAKPMIFDCHGHYMFFINNDETGTTTSGWMLAPSRSIVGQIAKDICAKR